MAMTRADAHEEGTLKTKHNGGAQQHEGCPVQHAGDDAAPSPSPSDFPEPPGPRGRRLRNLIRRLRDTTGFFAGLREEYGDVVAYRIMDKRFCLLFRPDLMEEVIARERDSFRKGSQERKTMENDCIITANGEDHERRRRLIQPSFTPKSIQGYSEKMVSELERVRDTLSDGDEIDMDDLATDLSLSIAGRTFFGDDMGVDTQLMKDYLVSFRWMWGLSHVPFERLAKAFPLPRTIKARRCIDEFHEAIYENIRRTRESSGRTDLISHLVAAWDAERPHWDFTEGELKDEVLAIIVASHVTIAATLTWCTYHLGRNPDVRARLEEEVDTVLGGRLPGFHDFPRLKYTKAIVDESLRMTPPVTYLGRVTTEDVVIGGYRIPDDTMVELAIRTPMRQDDYFPEQGRFRPERWLVEPKPKLPKLAYAPFGTGIRFCSGFRFALLELVLALSIFAQRWRFDLTFEGYPPIADVIFYKCREGLPVVVRRRPGRG